MDCDDHDYFKVLQKMNLSTMTPDCRNLYHRMARETYGKMLTNWNMLTNSEFSRTAIFKMHAADSTVLYPPVDLYSFRNTSLTSDARDDFILVISRFHPSKKIENAIRFARLLKQNELGNCTNIVRNISPGGSSYFNYLRYLVSRYGLEDFIRFELNASFGRLVRLMRLSKAYFHPHPGEPFGISTVEGMSAEA
jgi:glycosyltransferase involved in cell wall biosynthesis